MSSSINVNHLVALANYTLSVPGKHQTVPAGLMEEYTGDRMASYSIEACRVLACALMSLLLILAARTYKSLLFVLYQTNFFFMIIQAALSLAYYNSGANTFTFWMYTNILTDTNFVSPYHDRALSAAATIFSLLTMYSLLTTLIVQIWAAFGNFERTKRRLATAAAVLGCFPCFFIWTWYTIESAITTLDADTREYNGYAFTMKNSKWAQNGAYPVFTATITLWSVVLSLKLWFAARLRLRLGLERFNPIKLIMIIVLENGAASAILAIVGQAAKKSLPSHFGSITLMVTVVMLPLGYVWVQFETSRESADTDASAFSRLVGGSHGAVEKELRPSTPDSECPYSATSYKFGLPGVYVTSERCSP